jgi:hypothetical protein
MATKWPQNIQNSRTIDQMAIYICNVLTSSIARPSKNYPNQNFWLEKSGNPCYFIFSEGGGVLYIRLSFAQEKAPADSYIFVKK